MQESSHNDRVSERKPVFLNARCRKSSWVVTQVEVADISEGGCCIVGSSDGLEVGQQVILRFAGMQGIEGTVRRIEGADAGIEFTAAVDPVTIADLARTYSPEAGNVTDIRKFIGRN